VGRERITKGINESPEKHLKGKLAEEKHGDMKGKTLGRRSNANHWVNPNKRNLGEGEGEFIHKNLVIRKNASKQKKQKKK